MHCPVDCGMNVKKFDGSEYFFQGTACDALEFISGGKTKYIQYNINCSTHLLCKNME